MTTLQSIITIMVVMFGTMLTRFIIFIIFPSGKNPPAYIKHLGTVLPYAVMGLLVIYSLKDAIFTTYHGLPELLAILWIVIIHKWKKNTVISIATGTILYMILIQHVFTG